MAIGNSLEKVFRFFGKDANPTLVAAGIACAKAIFRPTFTMMDKKQDPDSKKYAAIRECLTEVIAIGVYAGSGALASLLAKSLTRAKENLPKKDFSKDVFKNIINETNLPNGISADRAHEIGKTFFKLNSSISMLGVFLSALVVIPAVCSLVIKPVMKAINKNKYAISEQPLKTDISQKNMLFDNKYKNMSSFARMYSSMPQSGMKVGGL